MPAEQTSVRNPARQEQLLALLILAAGLRRQGAGPAALRAAMQNQLALLPQSALSQTELDTLTSSLAALPPRLAIRAPRQPTFEPCFGRRCPCASSHLRSIFAGSEIDVYICSVCGTPFPFADEGDRRRPRAGVQRFCSQGCRGSPSNASPA